MRYSSEHKDATRKKVVAEASAALRVEGPDRLGVAEVMKRAGLTHGGFYAHFKSKDDLLVAAVEAAFAEGRARFERGGDTPRAQLSAFVDRYVSLSHRDRSDHGCPVTTVLNDIPRQSPVVREAFGVGLSSMAARIAAIITVGEPADRPDVARSAIAEMAGAVALSRAIGDEAEAVRWLEQSRRRVRARLGLPETSSEGAVQ
jgi:TetR/AcrR family transcriptional repressor of nem operon